MNNILDSKLYKITELIGNYFLLNLLWFIFSIPLITLFPATAALFGVVRDWIRGKNVKLAEGFWIYFKENFQSSLLFEGVFLIVGWSIHLYLKGNILDSLLPQIRILLYFLLIVTGISVLFTTVFFFPVVAHFHLAFKDCVVQAFRLSIYFFPTTIMLIVGLGITINLIFSFPPLIIILCSFTAHVVCKICLFKIEGINE